MTGFTRYMNTRGGGVILSVGELPDFVIIQGA
jgi:hypothetical protein